MCILFYESCHETSKRSAKYLAIISRPLALIPQNTVYVKDSFPTYFHSFIGNSICTVGHFYVQSTRFTYFPSYIVPILSKPYMTHLQQPHQAANRPVGRVSLCYVCPLFILINRRYTCVDNIISFIFVKSY